ncbi:Phage-related integrase/recombinase [Desulfosporosinus sp. I2]|nr:Phage-related integrase/recombinase [Desulfosporosinus sp. I2]
MNINNIIAMFFRDIGNKYAELSKKKLDSSIEDFFTFRNINIAEVNKKVVLDWLHYLKKDRSLKPSSINSMLWGIRTFFDYCVEENFLEENPFRQIKPLKVEKALPRPINNKILFAMKDASSDNIKYRTIIEVFDCTGVRISELVGIDLSDIKWDDRIILIRNAKGGFERFVPFTSKCGELIKEYLAIRPKSKDSALFLNQTKTRYSRRGIHYVITKYRQLVTPHNRVTLHMFRHTYATRLKEKEVSTQIIGALMGIRDLRNVEIYANCSNKLRKKRYEKYKR